MKLRSIEEQEELIIDSEKLKQMKICVDKLDDKLEDFIEEHSHWISVDEVSLLYNYNKYIKQNCKK